MKRALKKITFIISLLSFNFSVPVNSAEFFTIGSGASNNINFDLSNAICKMVAKQPSFESGTGISDKSFRCATTATKDSAFNLDQLKQDKFQFAFARSDEVNTAYKELASDQIKPFKEVRSVFSTTPIVFQIIAKRNSDIKDWKSLKGKIVRIGQEGTVDREAFDFVIEANSVNKSYFGSVVENNDAFAWESFCKGKTDAFGFIGTIPNLDIEKASNECGSYLVDLKTFNIDKIIANNSFYSNITIPKGTYKNNVQNIVAFGFVNNLVTHEKVSEEIVYNLVKSVFENFDSFKKENSLFSNLVIKQMIQGGLSAPLHPGAIKYYREKKWM